DRGRSGVPGPAPEASSETMCPGPFPSLTPYHAIAFQVDHWSGWLKVQRTCRLLVTRRPVSQKRNDRVAAPSGSDAGAVWSTVVAGEVTPTSSAPKEAKSVPSRYRFPAGVK